MEGSLNVDNFDKSLLSVLFSISFSMEGSLFSNRSCFNYKVTEAEQAQSCLGQ